MPSNYRYDPEQYWSELAVRTSNSSSGIQAGDDEPYYHYKREKFLELFRRLDFRGKKILEVGCGPGGNLKEVLLQEPKELCAVDISMPMVDFASKTYPTVQISKANGYKLEFPQQYFDIVFTVTVLQHNTNRQQLDQVIKSICQVSREMVCLFERTEVEEKGDALCMGRTLRYYEEEMNKHQFVLREYKYLNIQASYWLAGFARKVFNRNNRKEGDPLSAFSLFIQRCFLPVTKSLDWVIDQRRDLTMMIFQRV